MESSERSINRKDERGEEPGKLATEGTKGAGWAEFPIRDFKFQISNLQSEIGLSAA